MVIVVTGGIGSGKSEVSKILADRYSCHVYEADREVKRLYERYDRLVSSIEKALDMSLRNEAGRFEPSYLAARIFTDREALLTVEKMVFPYLIRDFQEFAACNAGCIVFESATVLDKPQFDGFGDVVILVDAPLETRVKRAVRRDSSAPEKIMERMRNQRIASDDPRISYLIMNDGSLEELASKVEKVMERILEDSKQDITIKQIKYEN